MAIYVDPIFEAAGPNGHTRWSHMGTDDRSERGLAELHALAARIGLRRDWYQDKLHHKHYDVTPLKRRLAVRYGAVEVSQREYAKLCSDNPVLLRMIAANEAGEAADEVADGASGPDAPGGRA